MHGFCATLRRTASRRPVEFGGWPSVAWCASKSRYRDIDCFDIVASYPDNELCVKIVIVEIVVVDGALEVARSSVQRDNENRDPVAGRFPLVAAAKIFNPMILIREKIERRLHVQTKAAFDRPINTSQSVMALVWLFMCRLCTFQFPSLWGKGSFPGCDPSVPCFVDSSISGRRRSLDDAMSGSGGIQLCRL